MQQLVLLLHVLTCVSVIGLVLIQHGKGADMGAAFGSGSANTMFGSSGPTSFLMKLTGVLAAIFFVTSFALGHLIAKSVKSTKSTTQIVQQQLAPVQFKLTPVKGSTKVTHHPSKSSTAKSTKVEKPKKH